MQSPSAWFSARCAPLVLAGLIIAGVSSQAIAAPFAYIPRSDGSQVAMIDLATNSVVANISLAGDPFGIAADPVGSRVYVTHPTANLVTVIDAATNAVIRAISLGPGPLGAAVSPSGTRLAVALTGGSNPGSTLAVLDTSGFTLVATVNVGLGPSGVVYNPSGSRIYVANTSGNSVSVIDGTNYSVVATVPVLSAPRHMAINANATRLYVSHIASLGVEVNRVTVIDLSNNTVLATIPVGQSPYGLALNPAGTRLVVANQRSNDVSVIDTASNTVIDTVIAGTGPISVGFHPDGSRFYVVNSISNNVIAFDAVTRARLATIPVSDTPVAFGNFISLRQGASGAATPGALSGLWWNPAESGWGINLTERGNKIFAAWYTYDGSGNPKWYVASSCDVIGSSCSGALYQVSGPRFFNAPFDPASANVIPAGNLILSFAGNDSASMTYSVSGQTRTVPIVRQIFQSGTTAPAVSYTDLWWNPKEAGWGMAITQQYNVMFVAWYVYDDFGNPKWYVASNCVVSGAGNGCSGSVYRTTGPVFGPTFDASRVKVFDVGTLTLRFTDNNNAILTYIVDGLSGSKSITRQIF